MENIKKKDGVLKLLKEAASKREEVLNFFLNCKINDISQVYVGKRNGCRCGCRGNYLATSFMDNPRSEVNDKKVKIFLKKAKKLVEQEQELKIDIDIGDSYIDIELPHDNTYTFYFDEIKDKK